MPALKIGFPILFSRWSFLHFIGRSAKQTSNQIDGRYKIYYLATLQLIIDNTILYLLKNNYRRLYSKDRFPIIRCTINVYEAIYCYTGVLIDG